VHASTSIPTRITLGITNPIISCFETVAIVDQISDRCKCIAPAQCRAVEESKGLEQDS
jgi:hypothetical protein